MERHPVILSIAGSYCSGGAGIQADIKTISALGGYAASAITAITVQNTLGVRAVQSISPDMVRGQAFQFPYPFFRNRLMRFSLFLWFLFSLSTNYMSQR